MMNNRIVNLLNYYQCTFATLAITFNQNKQTEVTRTVFSFLFTDR